MFHSGVGGTGQQYQRGLRTFGRLVACPWCRVFTEMPIKTPGKPSLSLWKYMKGKQTDPVENRGTQSCENAASEESKD